MPKLVLAIKNFLHFYVNFQVPFIKIVFPFFKNNETFLAYAQVVKSMLSDVTHLYEKPELKEIIDENIMEAEEIFQKALTLYQSPALKKNRTTVDFLN